MIPRLVIFRELIVNVLQIKVSGMIVREETEMAEKINELISDVNCRSAAKDYYLLMVLN